MELITEKSPTRRTKNDGSFLPKRLKLVLISYFPFQNFISKKIAYLIFQNLAFACQIYLALFPFFQIKFLKTISEFENHRKFIWAISGVNFGRCTLAYLHRAVGGTPAKGGQHRAHHRAGRTRVQPNPGNGRVGPALANGSQPLCYGQSAVCCPFAL